MHPRIVLAIARKDLLDVLRNRSTLMALLSPIFISILYFVLSLALQGSSTTVAVYNPGHSALVSASTLPANTKWNIIDAPSADAVRTMVDTNAQDTAVGIVLPADTDAVLKRGDRPAVQIYYHAVKFTAFQQQVLVATLVGVSQQIAGQQPPIAVTATPLRIPDDQKGAATVDFGKQLQSTFGMIALLVGLISAGMLLVPSLLVEEKEKKTLRMILASPASYGDVIAGKLLVGFFYTALLSIVLLTVGRLPVAALPQMALFMVLGGVFFLLVGLTLSAFSKTMTEVNSYGTLVFFLAMVPIMLNIPGMDSLSGAIGGFTRLIPNFYIVDGMRRALEGTGTLENILLNAGVTVGFIVALFLLATWLLRRQQLSAA